MTSLQRRYPDSAIRAFDPRFTSLTIATASVECLFQGTRWSEGPVWFGDARQVLWSDIPNNRIMRWEEETGVVSEFRRPSNFANGNTRDRQGRLVTCEHLTRRITRTEYDGSMTVLADSYQGKPLNSPNDVVVKSDDSVWFSDPPFGISSFYEGEKKTAELKPAIYRIDGKTGALSLIFNHLLGPNGLAFSPDEKMLYVVDSRSEPRTILSFDVADDGKTLSNEQELINAGPGGTPDGFRVDMAGNLWCGWGMGSDELDGVRVFSPQGEPIGHITLPERCANVCFGGLHRNRLFMAASHGLYSLFVNTQGAKGG